MMLIYMISKYTLLKVKNRQLLVKKNKVANIDKEITNLSFRVDKLVPLNEETKKI